jgi:hypothetical protein
MIFCEQYAERSVVAQKGLPVIYRSGPSRFLALFIASSVSACGVYTPDKNPFVSDAVDTARHTSAQGEYETAIVGHIACELAQGLKEVQVRLPSRKWLDAWGTTITHTITVEDQTGVSPGVSAVTPMNNGLLVFPAANGGNVTLPQSFSFSLGGTASANSLRTETVQYTYSNSQLMDVYDGSSCRDLQRGVMIDGDLKIKEFIFDKAVVAGPSISIDPALGPSIPFNTFTEEITFVGSYGVSATPTWHLARLSANASSNLLVSQRTNTNDLIITLGPLKCPARKFGRVISMEKLFRDVDEGKVLSAVVKGTEIDVLYKDKTTAQAYAPNIPDLLGYFFSHKVPVDGKSPDCPEKGPAILADSAMNQHQARVQAAAIAVSVTSQTH